MKNKLRNALMLALALVMVLSLCACGGKDEAPAASASPAPAQESAQPSAAPEAEAPATEDPLLPEATPVPTADPEGLLTYTSMSKGFSFKYSDEYITMSNAGDNAVVYAALDLGLPFCTVSLYSGTDAVSYLNELIAGVQIEQEGRLVKAPEAPAAVESMKDRSIHYIYYTYTDEEAGGTVACAYYAEDLPSGDVAVYNSTALESDTKAVDDILALAIQSFSQSK